jgi:phage terminase small subunit
MRTNYTVPILRNPRHEKFAQLLSQGQSAHQAYIDAGFRPSRQNAARLKTKEDVAARLLELQAASAVACKITVESICTELDEAITIAKAKGQPNALVSAAGLRAKLGGLLIDKAQVEVSNNSDLFDDCESAEDVTGRLADQMLGGLTNARWLPITDQDRAKLADIFSRAFAQAQAFLDSVNRRPLNTGQQPAAFLTKLPKPEI